MFSAEGDKIMDLSLALLQLSTRSLRDPVRL